MRIGIDARLLYKEGIGRHIAEVLAGVSKLRPEHEYMVYVKSEGAGRSRWDLPRRPNVRLSYLPGAPFLLREQIALVRAMTRDRLDLFHATFDYGMPLRAPCKVILTVHDAWFGPQTHFRSSVRRIYYQTMTRRGLRLAARVLTVSEFVKNKILAYCGGAPSPAPKIRVVPNGVGEEFHPAAGPRTIPPLVRKHGIDRYLLYVGALATHKNFRGLLEGYALLRRKLPAPPRLVVAGQRNPGLSDPARIVRAYGLDGAVLLPGYVPDAELPALYRGAEAFVFPSLHEGFGLPVVEAMACGTPVLSSNVGAIPEVARDAALLVDPADPAAIQEGLAKILTDQALRNALIERGLIRVKEFSWRKIAEEICGVYETVHGER